MLRRAAKPAEPAVTLPEETPVAAGGKGRATPRRSDARAERARARKAAPQSRRERSAARREAVRESRAALTSTDVSKLPKSEQAPELVYTRDLVDSRVYLGQGLLWLAIITVVAGMIVPFVQLVAMVLLVILVVQSWFDTRLIERKVRERYPTSTHKVRMYAFRRIVAPRRMRRPVPRIAKGAEIP